MTKSGRSSLKGQKSWEVEKIRGFKRKAVAFRTRVKGTRKQVGKSFPVFAATPSPLRRRKAIPRALRKAGPFAGVNPLIGDMRRALEAKPILTLRTPELRSQKDFDRLASKLMKRYPGMTKEQATRRIAAHLRRKYPYLKHREIITAQRKFLEKWWREKGVWFRAELKKAPRAVARAIARGLAAAEEELAGRPFAGRPYAEPPAIKVEPVGDLKTVKEIQAQRRAAALEALRIPPEVKEAAAKVKVTVAKLLERVRRKPKPEEEELTVSLIKEKPAAAEAWAGRAEHSMVIPAEEIIEEGAEA